MIARRYLTEGLDAIEGLHLGPETIDWLRGVLDATAGSLSASENPRELVRGYDIE